MFNDKPSVTIDCKQSAVRCVRFNVGGEYALTCGSDRTLKLWNPDKKLLLRTYPGHSDEVVDCVAKEDNNQIGSCSLDRSIIIWDVATAKIVRRFRNLAPFTCLTYSHDSSVILGGSTDGTARIYDLRATSSWEPIQTLDEAIDCINTVRVHMHRIFTTSSDCCLREYDIRKGKLNVDKFDASLNSVEIIGTDDSLCVLVNTLNGKLHMMDQRSGRSLNEYEGHTNKRYKLDIAFIDKLIGPESSPLVLSGSENGKIFCWNSMDQSVNQVLDVNLNPLSVVNSLSYSKSKHQLITSCCNEIQLWKHKE